MFHISAHHRQIGQLRAEPGKTGVGEIFRAYQRGDIQQGFFGLLGCVADVLRFGCGNRCGAGNVHGGLVIVHHRHGAGEFRRFGAVMARIIESGRLARVFQRQGEHVFALGQQRAAR